MLFSEMKRKYFNIVFLLIIIVGGWWMYSAIKPSANTVSYDIYKYSYYKPLSKVEFIYFNLKRDYEEGTTIAYSNTDDKRFYQEYTVKLNDTSKKDFLDIIKKMNPNYKATEKMNDVKLNISIDEIKTDLEKLEKQLKCPSFYYTGMYAPEFYNEEYDMIESPSPYWIYLECGKSIFSDKEYFQKRKDFNMLFKKGISNGYAYVALDYLGILIGILSIIYSFQTYSEDKRANINGFIYTERISSIQHVLSKYFATVIPLMIISFCYMTFVAVCFFHWNDEFEYGYSVEVFTFLKQVPLIIFPTIFVIVAISQFIGIIIQNEIINAILQFIFFYLSMSGVPKHEFSFNTTIRYSDFDDYSFYSTYLKYLPSNRFLMVVLSVILLCFVIILFEYRKEHEKLFNLDYIRKIMTKPVEKISIYSANRQSAKIKSLPEYLVGQSVNVSALMYIPYLCAIMPIVISKNMNASSIATIGENIIIFASIFLFIRLGNMEKINGMEEQVFTTNIKYPLIYLMRVFVASGMLFIMVEIPLVVLCIWSRVDVGRWCIGVYLSSLFIGMLSLLVTEVFEKSFAGYFVYIMYYFLDTILKNGMFITLSGYTKRIGHTKVCLFVSNVLILAALMICVFLKMEGTRITNRYGNKN